LAPDQLTRRISVPRLSIIIPHRHNDLRLEASLLSVLENRPEESEIIVVHDGSYADPYQLADEVLFVSADPGSNTLELLNAGMLATCAPTIAVVLDGTRVRPEWAERPLKRITNSNAAAVAVAVDYPAAHQQSLGISTKALHALGNQPLCVFDAVRETDCGGPSLACGFYRRQVLLSLGGWNAVTHDAVADIELAIAISELGLECACEQGTTVEVSDQGSIRKLSAGAWAQLASLSQVHGATTPSLLESLRQFAGRCARGQFVAALAWARGRYDAHTIRRTQLRIAHARQQLGALEPREPSLRLFSDQASEYGAQRRAA